MNERRRARGVRLMKCQTWLRGALMTALSTTEVEVGMMVEDDMLNCFWRSDFFLMLKDGTEAGAQSEA